METYHHLKIKEWSLEDRPREKLITKGTSTLSDAELIAILIGSGSAKESAVDLSKKILKDVNHNLNELGKVSVKQLVKNYHGIGEAKAISIIAALELGRRRKNAEVIEKPKIACSRDAFEQLHPFLSDLSHEEFWVMNLNRANKVISKYRISQGGVSGTVIVVKLIMKTAIENLASSIILCHNHPSGNKEPSDADNEITKKLKEAGNLMDIPVLDHIIVAGNQFYSYADAGLL